MSRKRRRSQRRGSGPPAREPKPNTLAVMPSVRLPLAVVCRSPILIGAMASNGQLLRLLVAGHLDNLSRRPRGPRRCPWCWTPRDKRSEYHCGAEWPHLSVFGQRVTRPCRKIPNEIAVVILDRVAETGHNLLRILRGWPGEHDRTVFDLLAPFRPPRLVALAREGRWVEPAPPEPVRLPWIKVGARYTPRAGRSLCEICNGPFGPSYNQGAYLEGWGAWAHAECIGGSWDGGTWNGPRSFDIVERREAARASGRWRPVEELTDE